MCHGIVRQYCQLHRKVVTFAKEHNYDSVSFMYRDLENLEVIKGDDSIAKNYIKENPHVRVKCVGFGDLNPTSPLSLDKQFYQLAQVEFDHKYSSFNSLVRDPKKEEKLFNTLKPKSNSYIFCHDDPSRNMSINLKHKLPIIKASPTHTSCIFDYCKIIEEASEIHVIDSSFFFLVDCLNYTNTNQSIFSHRYLRQHLFSSHIEIPHHQKDWKVLTKKPE
tara:strand:- start:3638 stop:4297 length:660 start_codon:yes stop_codon:yes gene_type:complete